MQLCGKICEIDIDDEASWQQRLFLTFDTDWAHDDVIADTIDLLDAYRVSATWFVTHATKVLPRLSSSDCYQIGLHPNFNMLLNGDNTNGANACEVLTSIQKIAPDATAVRSHSLTQNERLIDLFSDCGLTHVSNSFIPFRHDSLLMPWRLWGGITSVPHCWQDNVALKMPLELPRDLRARNGIVVVNFHPIHVFLNTESMDRYEGTRRIHQQPRELIKHRFEGNGTRTALLELLDLATAASTS